MSDAKVTFETADYKPAAPGEEVRFSFQCPSSARGRCNGGLLIFGRTPLKRDPHGNNGGAPQWDWDGNREKPTFSPSINCTQCWHGFIQKGRCVNVSKQDEPEPR